MAIEGGLRTRTAACPSCGGRLRFRGATSIVAVCAYCQATLVREGARLEDIGRQAELLPDDTLLQIGTTGVHRGEPFTLVGRIQYRYGAGLWNEWHALFDRGKSAWVTDANRDYAISFLAPPADVPAFSALAPGATLTLAGEAFTVTNVEAAQVVAGEGELPFRFQAGWEAPVADLRGAGARFATIDYSEDVPHVYVGERLPFDLFKFDGLRDPDRPVEPGARALAFKCGGCGAPIEKHVPASEVVACGSCGTVTDVAGQVGEIVQRNELNQSRARPTIPLGTSGRWRNVEYEVVGHLRRRITADGTNYEWSEYLLHNLAQGYLWISEYAGHFSVIRDAAEKPAVAKTGQAGRRPDARYLGRDFRHFQHSEPKVVALAGEFNWRVRLGDQCVVDDYVAPPLILSSERTATELTWSLGEYVEPAELWQAFGLRTAPPPRVGVAPNQPSPHKGRTFAYWAVFLAAVCVALVMQFGFVLLQSGAGKAAVAFSAVAGSPQRTVSGVLDLGSPLASPAIVHIHTDAQSAWVDVDLQLVDVDSGRAWRLARQLGYRTSGLQAAAEDVASIAALPGGRYTLTVDARAGAGRDPRTGKTQSAVTGQVRIFRSKPGWSSFWLLAGFLFLWPLVASLRAAAFEARRWAESDYPPQQGGDEDDDEDD